MSKYTYLYRAKVISWPDGSHEKQNAFGQSWDVPVRGWHPPGWQASAEYVERFHTDEFFWPSVGRQFKSRAAVKRRVELLESFGATAVVERSSRITWPESGGEDAVS